MKKKIIVIILIIILAISLITAFIIFNSIQNDSINDISNEQNENTSNEIIENESTENEIVKEEYVDSNPIKIGIYLSEDGKRTLQTSYTNKWQYHQDINVFNVLYTQEKEVENTSTRICYGKYLENYDEDIINNYRNGFNIKFTTSEGTIDKTILSPKDTEEFFDYLEIYLYDSYHRKAGEWFSHTTEEEFNEKTALTSIKLTAGKKVNEITSDIELTAFTYDNDDFDVNGKYRGISKYSITVKRSEN